RRKTVPPPIVAVAAHQPLPGLELRRQARPVAALDDADLREPPRQLGWRAYKAGKRLRAIWQNRIGRIDLRAGPAHRRRSIDRRIEIIAECGAERLLVALVDAERVHHRRPQILALDREQLADGLRFGLQPLYPLLGSRKRRA